MNWKPAGSIYQGRFAVVITDDGSPTIRDLGTHQQECMHHSGGAYRETQYIYGEAIRTVIQSDDHPRFLVVGLGLGYIEILTACEWLKSQKPGNCQVISFESAPYWRGQFTHWLNHQPCELAEIYQRRDAPFTQDYPQEMPKVRDWLRKNLTLEKELSLLAPWQNQIQGILFDAYSSKTSHDLWQEDFLTQLVRHYAAANCLWVTYASTGNLKRALQSCGFTLHKRAGFQGKKESTWATRS
ncbi:MAG: MnmC family methyltransferase [Gloeomargarita sp. DG02_4_bins_56]